MSFTIWIIFIQIDCPLMDTINIANSCVSMYSANAVTIHNHFGETLQVEMKFWQKR